MWQLVTDNIGVVAAFNSGSSTCLLAHTMAKALFDVSASLNVRLSVVWRRRCSDRSSVIVDALSKADTTRALSLMEGSPTPGYVSRTLTSFMKNPTPERCLGKAITVELSSWMEVLDNQVEWKDSYSHLVKYPVNRVL